MAQSTKSLLCRHEGLNSDPQFPGRGPGGVARATSPVQSQESEGAGPLGLVKLR